MKATIITIGDEILIGQILDTNSRYISRALNSNGITVGERTSIGDNRTQIIETLDRALSNSEVVIITGGLGPTKDDITKTVLCQYFGDTLVRHQPTYDQVARFFERRGLPFTEINQAQALVPSRCKVILNEVGTAPCMMFAISAPQATFEQPMPKKTDTLSEKIVISMPGVPFEMKWLMQNSVLPLLEEQLGSQAIVHKTILTFGIGESFLADKIADWEDALPAHIKLAYLPEAGKVRLRLSAYGEDKAQLEQEVAEQIVELNAIISDNIYGYDDDTISKVIGKIVNRRCALLATAESCTGGLIGNMITEVPGSSAYYKGGIIAYSNELKERLLGVRHETLEQYGAVSEETAIEMAKGCLEATGADYAIATTGISGPTGATEEKPLGLVYVAIASRDEVVCNRYVFTTTRQQHQQRTANQALFDLYKLLTKNC